MCVIISNMKPEFYGKNVVAMDLWKVQTKIDAWDLKQCWNNADVVAILEQWQKNLDKILRILQYAISKSDDAQSKVSSCPNLRI